MQHGTDQQLATSCLLSLALKLHDCAEGSGCLPVARVMSASDSSQGSCLGLYIPDPWGRHVLSKL